MTPDMAGFFQDMATVEAEMREDIRIYAERGITPARLALRIRKHPALQITSRNKMAAAETVDASYAKKHPQTTKYRAADRNWLHQNWKAGSHLVDAATKASEPVERSNGSLIYTDVPVRAVLDFLNSYEFHEDHADLKAGLLERYVKQQVAKGRLQQWSVVVVSRPTAELMVTPLGAAGRLKGVERSRLTGMSGNATNIKALMSVTDMLLDLEERARVESWGDAHSLREESGAGPLLLLYPINRNSRPAATHAKTRDPLDAVADVLGVGFAFPDTEAEEDVNYVAVEAALSSRSIPTNGAED